MRGLVVRMRHADIKAGDLFVFFRDTEEPVDGLLGLIPKGENLAAESLLHRRQTDVFNKEPYASMIVAMGIAWLRRVGIKHERRTVLKHVFLHLKPGATLLRVRSKAGVQVFLDLTDFSPGLRIVDNHHKPVLSIPGRRGHGAGLKNLFKLRFGGRGQEFSNRPPFFNQFPKFHRKSPFEYLTLLIEYTY